MSTTAKLLWLSAYVGAMAAIVWLAFPLRERVVTSLSTTEAAREWNQWRTAAQEQANKGPVARRPPKSTEPPALIMMRDHFPAILAAGLVFGTFLFVILFISVRALLPDGSERQGTIKIGEPKGGPL
jgi:hypothetical protein